MTAGRLAGKGEGRTPPSEAAHPCLSALATRTMRAVKPLCSGSPISGRREITSPSDCARANASVTAGEIAGERRLAEEEMASALSCLMIDDDASFETIARSSRCNCSATFSTSSPFPSPSCPFSFPCPRGCSTDAKDEPTSPA